MSISIFPVKWHKETVPAKTKTKKKTGKYCGSNTRTATKCIIEINENDIFLTRELV